MAAGDIALVGLQGKGFPAGTVLEAHLETEGLLPYLDHNRGGLIPDTPAGTQTVSASGAATFSGLTAGKRYVIIGWHPVTGVAGTDVLTASGVGGVLKNGDPVKFRALTGGAPLSTATQYYARDVSGDTFKVATTPGGAAVDITADLTAGRVKTPVPLRVIQAAADA
jgi:hypothetical protein